MADEYYEHYDATCEPFRSWNRLEPRPRRSEFDTVLKAGIHDAMWMLTRQWQFGEFKGEDTGSAVFAKVQLETTRVTKFKNNEGVVVPYDETIPLETLVERMPVSYDLRFRARAGQHWLNILASHGATYNSSVHVVNYDHPAMKRAFIQLFPISLPVIDHENDPTALQLAKARLIANKQAHQTITGLSGRTPDGVAWYESLKQTGDPVALPVLLTTHAAYNAEFNSFMLAAANEFIAWFERSHEHPGTTADTSWAASNLEYSFRCSMPNKEDDGRTVLDAKEYYSGHLDWYAFNLEMNEDESGLATPDEVDKASTITSEVLTVIPSEARFGGMPNSRWWEFEDASTDLGNITAETTNIAEILLAEFALMYSNDWFVIPYAVPAGAVAEVKGILVTDVFGERTLVEVAGQGSANDWTSWTMFNLTQNNSNTTPGEISPLIYIPPVANKVLESGPIESVAMVRDEMANMVWGVEITVPDLVGGGRDGHAAAQELKDLLTDLERQDEETPSPVPEGVKIRFDLGNTVPENWIPFLPVHMAGQNRAIQLQRASMPRWFNNEFSQVRPRTSILRHGMRNDDLTAVQLFVNPSDDLQDQPYFVYEEEVPGTGVVIDSYWQRTRWYDGKTVCWYGRRKRAGKGEGSSGLAFDRVIDVDYEGQEALVPKS